MITKPTRITATTATLIDNILIDQRLEASSSSGILVDNASDHLPCYTIISDVHPNRKSQLEITSRDIRPKNIQALKKFLSTPGTLLPLNGDNASKQFNHFHNCLQEAVDHFLPIKTRKISARSTRREPWVTAGLLRCIRKTSNYTRKMLKNRNNQTTRLKYQDYNNLLQKVKKSARRSYYFEQRVGA